MGAVNCRHVARMALKDGKKGITAYLPPDLLKRVKIYGLMTDQTLTDTVIDALTEYLDKRDVPQVQASGDSKTHK